MTISDRQLLDAILRAKFEPFLRRSFVTLHPSMPFVPNWHHRAIAFQLERIRRGETTRLILNMPPRSLKSLMVTVAFPAFLLGLEPWHRIFTISYSSELALKLARDSRSIMTAPWYRRAFPNMRIARETDDTITTTLKGFRQATSIGGSLTGMGGDMFIIDDPLKPLDAQSEPARSKVNQWIYNTLMSRLDNKQTGVIIVVMQRVHIDDLCGFLTACSDDWEVLSLPAIAAVDERIPIGDNEFNDCKAGEVLHPAYEPLETLLKLKRDLGSDLFAAQYQQCPVPPGGAMIKRRWLRYYDPDELPDAYGTRILHSWDTAGKDGPQSSWSVCTVWLIDGEHFYFLDLVRDRFDYPGLRKAALELAKRYPPSEILIEDASTGIALAQELQDLNLPVRAVPVEGDKVTRLFVQQAKFEAGLVHFPRNAAFLPELEAELLSFPNGKTDDIVDSISQALANGIGGYDTSYNWV